MGIAILGPLVLDGHDGSRPAPRERVVLAALAARPGEVVAPGALAEALWADTPPPSWPKVVQGCVVRLRRTLGRDAIVTDPEGYRLALPPDHVDAVRFVELAERARRVHAVGQHDRAAHLCEQALDLWRGPALPELADWLPGASEGRRLDELRHDVQELRLEARLVAGHAREVVADAAGAVAEAPLRERRWALLARAHYATGRQADALDTLRRARALLAHELGVDPGAELVALERDVLQQDPALGALEVEVADQWCPYPGLRPFGREHADGFFGREQDLADAMARVDGEGVLCVVGPSGSGKSSLVLAGVVPALEARGHRVVVLVPGREPADVLAAARLRPGDVLVVDQAEEVVTLCRDPDQRDDVLDALARHARSAPVVLAVRADGLGGLSRHAGVASLVERGIHLLTPLSADELRAAVERPARQAGLHVEPGLVDLLLRDVAGEPGALPLVAHALRQTWERREGRTLTVDGYLATGGIHGAVAQSAERLHDDLPPHERAVLRDLLLRLVDTTADGAPVRVRVPLGSVAGDEVRGRLVDRLVHARLVTSDAGTVEVAHEALLRAWPRLQVWLDDDAEGQRVRRHLSATAEAWEAMGHPDSELYRGVRLARAVEWAERAAPRLTEVEARFLAAGRDAAATERRAAEEAVARQARTNRRLRALVVVVALLAVVAGLGSGLAVREATRADGEAARARAQELAASAITALDDDPSLASLLAVAAAGSATPRGQTSAALHRTLAADRVVARYRLASDAGIPWTDLHPDGDVMAVAGPYPVDGSGAQVEVVDPRTDDVRWHWDVWEEWGNDAGFVAAPRFADGGDTVVVGAFWDTTNVRRLPLPMGGPELPSGLVGIHVRDARTGRPVARIDTGRCGAHLQDVGGRHAVVRLLVGDERALQACDWAGARTAVALVDLGTGTVRALAEHGVGGLPWGVGGAIDDRGTVVAHDDPTTGQVVLRDAGTGAELRRVPGHTVRDLDVTGDALLLGTRPPTVVDVASGRVAAELRDHVGPVLYARFGDRPATVLTTGADGALRVWSTRTGDLEDVVPAVGDGPVSVSGDLVAVSQLDRETVNVVDLTQRGGVGHVMTCAGEPIADSLVAVEDALVATVRCAEDAAATTFSMGPGDRNARVALDGQVGDAVAVAPGGGAVVRWESGSAGPVVRRLVDGGLVARLGDAGFPRGARIERVRWSPDGRRVAAAAGRAVAVWDVGSGHLLGRVDVAADTGLVADVLFDPERDRLVVSDTARALHAVSTETWEVVESRLVFTDGAYRIGLLGTAPDGSLLTVGPYQGGGQGSLSWFDPDTFDLRHTRANVHGGAVAAVAWSPDRRRVATASADRSVRVWDALTGELEHEVPVAGDPAGVAFTDQAELAVLLRDGVVDVHTIDHAQLHHMAVERLTRGFTIAECLQFAFGDACPTLAELGARRSPPGPDVVAGTWELAWTADELAGVVLDELAEETGRPVDAVREDMADLAADLAGTYRITLARGRFEVRRSGTPDVWCAGTYELEGGRLHLWSERGWWCYEVRLFSADVRVDEDRLVVAPADFRGAVPDRLVFATRPWHRTA